MKLILFLILIAFAASKRTIPDLYSLNKGRFTSDYSVTYNHPSVSGTYGVVAEAGDINNDGMQDFMISDPYHDNDKGIVYVVYGKPGSLRQFKSMDDFLPSDGFIMKGKVNGQHLGFSLSHAGDINGDGIDDIIIGSESWNRDQYATKVGMVHVVFGRKNGAFPSVLDLDLLPASQGFKIFGEGPMNYLGFSVSAAGDVNSDGISDIILGAFGANGESGKAYVIYGSKQGFANMQLPLAQGKGFTVEGSNGERLGNSVSQVGDFNGDGVDDLIIGAHVADQWRGKAYIIFGRKEGFPTTIRATEGIVIQDAKFGDNLGCAVSGVGDFNGDGLQDVIIGAYGANGGRGSAYVILGSRQNPRALSIGSLSPSRGFSVTSRDSIQLAQVVAGGRDLNGDGLSDILISAPESGQGRGSVFVIYGVQESSFSAMSLDNLKPRQGYVIVGANKGDKFGTFVRPLRDVNNDGVNDFAVGAFNANSGKGATYMFYLPWKCMDKCSQCSRPDTCDTCASDRGLLNNDCVVCPPKTHTLVNGVCKVKCSANCQQCSKPKTCDVCAPGFGFLNDNDCVVCPTNTHILVNGVCKVKCSANCQQCSKPETCDVCAPGFGFLDDNDACIICPPETHILSEGICTEKCSQNCAYCSEPNTCDVCDSGFGFLHEECVTCPEKTHFLSNGFCKVKCPGYRIMQGSRYF